LNQQIIDETNLNEWTSNPALNFNSSVIEYSSRRRIKKKKNIIFYFDFVLKKRY